MRGVAALAVVAFHIGGHAGYANMAPYGYIAVDLFFMLSGFVIGNAYEAKLRSGDLSWRTFITIRFARLYPELALGCALGWLANPAAPLSIALRQFLLVPSLSDQNLFPLNPVFWSLLFEILINAIHAAIASRLSTRLLGYGTIIAGVVFLFLSWRSGGPGVGWGASTFFGGLARVSWGYGVGLLVYRFKARLRPLGIAPGLCLLPVALLLFSPNLGFTTLQLVGTLFIALPLVLVLGVAVPSRGNESGLLVWLGALSYPLYAIHYPLLQIAIDAFPLRGLPLVWAAIGLGAVLLATIAERWFERPVRRWLRSRVSDRDRTAATGADSTHRG